MISLAKTVSADCKLRNIHFQQGAKVFGPDKETEWVPQRDATHSVKERSTTSLMETLVHLPPRKTRFPRSPSR